jgi:hypothetical protein
MCFNVVIMYVLSWCSLEHILLIPICFQINRTSLSTLWQYWRYILYVVILFIIDFFQSPRRSETTSILDALMCFNVVIMYVLSWCSLEHILLIPIFSVRLLHSLSVKQFLLYFFEQENYCQNLNCRELPQSQHPSLQSSFVKFSGETSGEGTCSSDKLGQKCTR